MGKSSQSWVRCTTQQTVRLVTWELHQLLMGYTENMHGISNYWVH